MLVHKTIGTAVQAVQAQVRCVEILGLMFLGQLYCLGLEKADFKKKLTLKLNSNEVQHQAGFM